MSLNRKRRVIGRQAATPPSRGKSNPSPVPDGLPATVQPHTLAEQQANFTAEGSPPPGKVATNAPERSTEPNSPAR